MNNQKLKLQENIIYNSTNIWNRDKLDKRCVRPVHGKPTTTLLKEINDLNKWRERPPSQTQRLNSVKMSILHKLEINKLNVIIIKIPTGFSGEIHKTGFLSFNSNSKSFTYGKQGTNNSQINLEKKVGGFTLLDF